MLPQDMEWGRDMITKYMVATFFAVAIGASSASAATCGGFYKVGRGDTLSQIADAQYKDAKKWSVIYRNNIKKIGKNAHNIQLGAKYALPCIDGLPTGLEGGKEYVKSTAPIVKKILPKKASSPETAVEVVATTKPMAASMAGMTGLSASPGPLKLLVADDYAPFLGRESHNDGMIQDVVLNAFASNPKVGPVKSYWINDWSAHLDPLLTDAIMDVGYPWLQPDCTSNPEAYRCQNFLFSDPMFEMLIMLFTDKNRPVVFNKDSDILGKTLCRPKGYYTHDLDKNGRNWLKDKKITLEQPVTLADCFEMLGEGKVDAVVINEFTGRAQIKKLGLEDSVVVVQSRPLSIEGHHVVVHKTHPNAEAIITLVNDSLAKIKKSGKYQEVIDDHLSKIWAEF